MKTNDPVTISPDAAKSSSNPFETRNQPAPPTTTFNVANPTIAIASDRDMDRWQFNGESPQAGVAMDDFNFNGNMPIGMNNIDNSFTWEMIGLGLEEPLPPQGTIDEL